MIAADLGQRRSNISVIRSLGEQQLVEHHQNEDSADYRLTAGGSELVDLLGEIQRWNKQHRNNDEP